MNLPNIFLPTIEHFQLFYYLLIFVNFSIEALAFVGFILPGTTAMLAIGFFAAQQFFNWLIGFLVAFFGCLLGTSLSYYLGKKGGHRFFQPEKRIFSQRLLDRGKDFFQRHGNKSILLASFTPYLRTVMPFIAGMFKMKTSKFILINFISIFLWVLTFGFLGYFFGQAWHLIALWSTRIGIFLLVFLLVVFLFLLLRQKLFRAGKQFFHLCRSIIISLKNAFLLNPEVQKLLQRYPRFFAFLAQRCQKRRFSGLPLTILVLIGLYLLSSFFGLVEDLLRAKPIVAADWHLENLLLNFRDRGLIQFFYDVTLIGKWYVALILVAIVLLIFWFWQKRPYFSALAISLAGNELSKTFFKMIFQRERPSSSAYLETTYSFPSGHAAWAVVFFGFLVYFLWRHLKHWKTKINFALISLALILLIGFSRLYLGVHYLSDVWGGYLLGLLWLLVGISLTEWQLNKAEKRLAEFKPSFRLKVISWVLILGAIGFYFGAIYLAPSLVLPAAKAEPIKILGADLLSPFKQNQISAYTEGLTGIKQEPISFLILARDDQQLLSAFSRSGWYLADKFSLQTLGRIIQSAVTNKDYLTAPMSPSFWQGQVHQFGFEKPTQTENIRERHHARFWLTNYQTPAGLKLYVGTASLDLGLKWGVVHKIKPDIDTDREVLFTDLQTAGIIKSYQKLPLVEPILSKNFAGDQFFTDGQVYLLELK